jgi:hypothetical protein
MSHVAVRPWFRLLFGVVCIVCHLIAFRAMGGERFKAPLLSGEPGVKVAFSADSVPLVGPGEPQHWNRLLVSRWDSQHYLSYALRGVSQCPPEDLRGKELPSRLVYCGFNFYPGYPVLGAALGKLGLPLDYALLAVSLAATLALVYLWTSAVMVRALGLWRTYLSLGLFNVFTTGFALVTIQTEAVTLALMFAAFIALEKDRIWLGALAAGAAGAMRVTGSAVGVAFVVALAVGLLQRQSFAKAARTLALAGPLSFWGQGAIFAYYGLRYHDPLLYVHAHGQAYAHQASFASTLLPSPERVLASVQAGLHEGIFLAFGFLFLALGHRNAVARFSLRAKVFLYVLALTWLGVSLLGSAGLSYAGMNRYWLGVPLLFLSMATVLERRKAALIVWGAVSLWHYWNVDLCVYLAEHNAAGICKLGYQP